MGRIKLLLGPRSAAVGPIPPVEVVVTNAGELQAAMIVATAAGGNTTIRVAAGDEADYGASTTVLDLKNYAPAAPISIIGQGHRTARLPRITLEGCQNIIVSGLEVYGERSGAPGGVITLINSHNIWITDNEIHADPLADQFFGGSFRVESVSGTFIEGEAVRVELAGSPTGGTGFFHSVPGVSTATNFVVSGSASDYKDGNGSGHWGNPGETALADRWYDLSTPRTLKGITSGATALIREKTSNVEFLVGVYSSTTQPSTNAIVNDNYIHDTKRGIGLSGTSFQARNNLIIDSYNAPVDLAGDMSNGIWNNNRCLGVWAQSTDGEPAGTLGPHSSVWGFSFTYRVVLNMQMWGNISLIGTSRQAAGWGVPFATGPKINDMEGVKTISISSGVATVSSAVGTWPLVVGQRVIGPGIAPETKIASITSGTGGAGSVFTVTPSQTVGSGSVYIQGRAEIDMKGNIFDCNGAIGVEFDFVMNSFFDYNTLISTRDTRLDDPTIPSLYNANIDAGCAARHNVLIAAALGDDSRYIAEQYYRDSYDNVVLIMGATSGPGSYEENLQGVGGGTPFSGATLENIVEMVTPIPGSAADGKGATFFWDFDTGTSLDPVENGAPITALAAGENPPMVQFDGTNAMRWTVAGAENLIGIGDANVLTQVWYLDVGGSDADANLSTSGPTGSDVYIRRLTSGSDTRLRFILKDSAGTTQQIDSIFTLSAVDGPLVFALSVDFANFKIYIWKGAALDPFPMASAWTGNPMRVTANTLTVLGSEAVPPAKNVTCKFGGYAVHDVLLDGTDPDVHTRLVALDGKPADWGAGCATLFGEQALGYIAGVASAYNGSGFNLGSAPGLSGFVRSGNAVTDV